MGSPIVTNDFNLSKVAQLHHVQVLNLNDLANSLKPLVLTREKMNIVVLKEGKEYTKVLVTWMMEPWSSWTTPAA